MYTSLKIYIAKDVVICPLKNSTVRIAWSTYVFARTLLRVLRSVYECNNVLTANACRGKPLCKSTRIEFCRVLETGKYCLIIAVHTVVLWSEAIQG